MAFLRSIKSKDILTSDERTNYLRNKNLFITATNSKSNGTFIKNKNDCLIAVNSYKNRFDISKGHNLVISDCKFKSDSIDPIPLGKLNEGNFLQANINNNKIINSVTAELSGNILNNNTVTSIYNPNNQISNNDPLNPPWSSTQSRGPFSQYTRWDVSGVFIDPNRIYVNKKTCQDLVYLKDPNRNYYYDISNNNGSNQDLIEILRNNTRLTNYSLTTKISLKQCKLPNKNSNNIKCSDNKSLPIINNTISQLTNVDIIDINNNLSVVLSLSNDGILTSSLSFTSDPNITAGTYTMIINPLPDGTYENESVTLTNSNNISNTLILKCFTVNNC